MNILFTIYHPLGFGGAEVSTKILAEELSKQHNIILASSGDYSPLKTIKLLACKRWPYFLKNSYLKNKFMRIIKENGIEIVHAHDGWTAVPAVLAARDCGIRSVVHFRDYWFVCPKSSCLHKSGKLCSVCTYRELLGCSGMRYFIDVYKLRYLRRIRSILSRADAKIALSSAVASKLLQIGLNQTHIVPSPIKLTPVREGRSQKQIVLYASGSLEKHKGIMNVLEAIINVMRKIPDFEFRILGDGILENTIAKRIVECELQDRIILVGKIKYERVMDEYQNASFVVFPSVWEEPIGRITIEAMLAGKPVVASNIGGIKDVVKDGETGFLVEPLGISEWSRKIELLLTDEKLRKRLGENGRNAAEQYASAKIAGQIEEIYEGLI